MSCCAGTSAPERRHQGLLRTPWSSCCRSSSRWGNEHIRPRRVLPPRGSQVPAQRDVSFFYTDPRGLDNPGMGPYGPGPNPGIPGMSPWVQSAAAAGAFSRNYQDMRSANTIGGDKYFHCKANCQASRMGPAGEQTAAGISDLREWSDATLKGDSPQACRADQAANAVGRSQGLASSAACSAVCSGVRPAGLPAGF